MPNLADVAYKQTGKSLAIDNLGVRDMQARAFAARRAQYLLLKTPPASGKSRALMFLGLDKLFNQCLHSRSALSNVLGGGALLPQETMIEEEKKSQ